MSVLFKKGKPKFKRMPFPGLQKQDCKITNFAKNLVLL